MVTIKGIEFRLIPVRDSYQRRALQYKFKIINSLKVFGLTEDDITVHLEQNPMKKALASVSWYMCHEHLFFSYNGCAKFVENLAMVEQVIKHFINLLTNEEIDKEQFLSTFVEAKDIIKLRKEAREVLGVDKDSNDFELMHKNYKQLSKAHHPDMPSGDTETFKKINSAHKILKKELG